MKRKPGRPVGTAKETELNGEVHFLCKREHKGAWVRKSRSQQKSLSRWLIEVANEAALDE